LQELDHVSIMKPITKFAATVPHTQRIPEIISMAFREAYNGRPGPSFLEIPRDVLDAKVDLDKVRFPEKYRLPYKVHGDPKAIELAASWFQQAERPARLAGSPVQFCRGAEALGVGAPFAIAAKTAMPDKEVFILFGDGAFGLTGFDIDTAVRFGLPFVSVVGNNAGWNQIRFGQLSKYGEKRGDVANKLSATRYDVIVEAMGGYGELVTQPQDIRPAMERARASGKPSCVNVILDPDIYSSGTMNQTMYK